MAKALNAKTIFISIFFMLSVIVVKAQSSFIIKKVVNKKNSVEITLCNNADSIINIPKFSLRITAKEKCNEDFWRVHDDTLYLTFASTAPDCLQGNIVANEIKYRDIALKPEGCCKQTLVLDRKIKFKYLKLSYDSYTTVFLNTQKPQ